MLSLKRLSFIYESALNIYKKTEEYSRLVALNLNVPDCLLISKRLTEYKEGLRGIGLGSCSYTQKYILYCDLSYLSKFLSLTNIDKVVIISNEKKLTGPFNFFTLTTYLESYIDLSSVTFNLSTDINHKVLYDLISSGININCYHSSTFVLRGDLTGFDVASYATILSDLSKINKKLQVYSYYPVLGLDILDFITLVFSNISSSSVIYRLACDSVSFDLSTLSSLSQGCNKVVFDFELSDIDLNLVLDYVVFVVEWDTIGGNWFVHYYIDN